MKSLKISLIIAIIASLIVSLSACNSNETTDSKNTLTTVSASIFPIYDIAKQIGGDKIQAHLLIQPGESPHTFEPTVTTKKNISNSNTVFVVGHLLDNWIEDLVDDKSKVVVVDKNISLMRITTTMTRITMTMTRITTMTMTRIMMTMPVTLMANSTHTTGLHQATAFK